MGPIPIPATKSAAYKYSLKVYMPHKSQEDRNTYFREVWYPKNRQKHIGFISKRRDTVRDQLAILIGLAKVDKHCKFCPESDSLCLDFHHRNPADKTLNIADIPNYGWSVNRLNEELAKCDLVCSNCHRKLHGRMLC